MKYSDIMAKPEEIPDAPEIIKACYNLDGKKVAELLKDGADVNSLDIRDNLTCLHIACMYGYDHIVEIILAHDRVHHDVDFTLLSSYDPRLAWQYASDCGHHDLATKVYNAGLASERRKAQVVPTRLRPPAL